VTSRDDLLQLLGGTSAFADADPAARARLVERAQVRTFAAGEAVLRAGDPSDECIVVTGGLLEVTVGDPPARIRLMGRGAVVGELGVITGEPRSATVRALRPTDVVVIPAADVDDLLATDAAFQRSLMRRLAVQVSESRPTEPSLPPPRRRIALIDSTAGRAAPVVDGLLAGVQVACAAEVVPSEVDFASLLAALHGADNRDRAVMVVRDPGGTAAEQCVRLADRVVVVADAGTAAPPAGAGSWAGCEVVAVGAGPIVEDEVAARYHVRGSDDAAGTARIARRLAGRSVGVVLSSGGARTFAHIGVLAELEAAGVVIDRVGACSLGCVAGVLYAGGSPPDEVQRIIAGLQPLPMYLEHGPQTIHVLAPLLAARCPTLERDFFCVSVDLTNGTRRVHRSFPIGFPGRAEPARPPDGLRSPPLARRELHAEVRDSLEVGLEASMALPGLVHPAVFGSTVFVDGALVDPLPVDVMFEDGDGPIVAIDVSGRPERMAYWSAQWAEPDATPPDLADVAVQAMDVASIDRRARARDLATLVIDPIVPFGTLAFDKLDELVEVGREAGREALASIGDETRRALGIGAD